jgi:hypothetical protein
VRTSKQDIAQVLVRYAPASTVVIGIVGTPEGWRIAHRTFTMVTFRTLP